jgi:hypothetical protein
LSFDNTPPNVERFYGWIKHWARQNGIPYLPRTYKMFNETERYM